MKNTKITYGDALRQSMEMLAENPKTIFLGYNICYGSEAYGTLRNISISQKREMPVAENLMTGMAIGMALGGYRPIVFFERQDFILNALDAIVNHLDKIESMSENQFNLPVILRATVGTIKPFNPGPQHSQNFTSSLKKMIKFPIYEPNDAKEVLRIYSEIKNYKHPVIIIEKRELYSK